jgi:hypothetical protein
LTYKDGNLIKEQEIEGSSVYSRSYEYDISKVIRKETGLDHPVIYLKNLVYNDKDYLIKSTSFAKDGSVEYEEEHTY